VYRPHNVSVSSLCLSWVRDDVDGGFPVVVNPNPGWITQLHEMLQQQAEFPRHKFLLGHTQSKFVFGIRFVNDRVKFVMPMEHEG